MPSTNRGARRTPPADDPPPELLVRAKRSGIASAFRWLLESGSAKGVSARRLGVWHERLLDELNGSRRRTGNYYTPPSLVGMLLDHALEPILAAKVSAATGRAIETAADLDHLSTAEKRAVAEAILTTTVLDPACGAGVFLEAAKERLFVWLRKATSQKASDRELRFEIAPRCLFGIDQDETAVLLTKAAVGMEVDGRIHRGDSLIGVSPWPENRFDVVVGNPPFANAIEGLVDVATKKRLADRYPELRGTADLAFYFLAAAHQFAAEHGAIGLVLPRAVLSAPAAMKLREWLLRERPPAFLCAPPEHLLFSGANVFVTLVVLKRGGKCHVRANDGSLRPIEVDSENWWRAMHRSSSVDFSGETTTVGDLFEVHASMTAGEAYALRPFLKEADDQSPLRFVTTGLIDPGVCHWGTKVCRYLGKRFQRPTISTKPLPDQLSRRVNRMRRPKVLVAGLSTMVEAFLDADGTHLGAVSTYSILHPKDDAEALSGLCARLNSEAAAERLRQELGATALGGGRITLTKRFLKGLPISNC
jgi:hypothetical protein